MKGKGKKKKKNEARSPSQASEGNSVRVLTPESVVKEKEAVKDSVAKEGESSFNKVNKGGVGWG